MSFPKKDRRTQSISRTTLQPERLTDAIAAALHREYGSTHAAVKTVLHLIGGNERAIKNWFEGKNAPNGESVLALCRHSDEVLTTFLRLAGRTEHLQAKRVVDATCRLRELLLVLDLSEDTPAGR